MNFNYSMPTRCFFGRDCLKSDGAVIATLGSKALIVTGKNSARINGSLEEVQSVLTSNGMKYEVFDMVEPNPSIETVILGGEMAKKFDADIVIGIGGGSPMDAAKAIAILANNEYSEDIYTGSYSNPVLPMVAIPTTAGTGSEVTPYSIITDRKNEVKRSISTHDIYPVFSFLDGKFMKDLPKTSMINTVIDAFSHAAEGYLAKRAMPVSDTLAVESIKIIGENIDKLHSDSLDNETRDDFLYASMLAGVVIAQSGTTIAHGMGYSLTVYKDIDHGRANGVIFCEFLKHCNKEQPKKVQNILDAFGTPTFELFDKKLRDLLGEYEHLTDDEINHFSYKASQTGNVHNTLPTPSEQDIKAIFSNSFR